MSLIAMRSSRSGGRAFSLMELLVVLGITALLAALIFASLRGVRQAALRTQSSSTLRSLSIASASYATENNQQILPGAVSPQRVASLRLRSHNPVDHAVRPNVAEPEHAEDAGSYVLRLLPYLESGWSVLLDDYRSGEITAAASAAFDRGAFGPGTASGTDLVYSAVPAFGYNSTFLGGNDVHGAANLRQLNPWENPGGAVARTRASDVRRPAFLVTFAPSINWQHAFEPGATPNPQLVVGRVPLGSAEIRPPVVFTSDGTRLSQWDVEDNAYVRTGTFGGFDGVPYARWRRDEIPTARFDGSVVTTSLTNLARDLRHWYPAELPETP